MEKESEVGRSWLGAWIVRELLVGSNRPMADQTKLKLKLSFQVPIDVSEIVSKQGHLSK
jgi:hypothetical protein